MDNKEKVKKKFAETEAEQPEVPEDFSCVDPPQQPLVLDYLVSFKQELRETVLHHLKLCLHCRDMAKSVLTINRFLEPKPGHSLHAGITEGEPEPVS